MRKVRDREVALLRSGILVASVAALMLVVLCRPSSAQPIGSFTVDSGPHWTTNPPTYNCTEACALLFGGSAGQYFCSTSNVTIDHMAYVDGWGDFQYCSTPVSETFKLNTFYDCGSVGCSYSAYVSDHFCSVVNYCWPGCNYDGVIDSGEECDDGNMVAGDGCSSCQIDECYTCSGQPSTCSSLPDGASCDDGLFCNGADSCASAACSVHGTDPCIGGGDCNDVCNEATDSCAEPPFAPCTDDGNGCTDDYCDGAGMCIHPDNFNFCDDGLFCNGQDYCFSGGCNGHFSEPCSVFNYNCYSVCDEMSDMCTPSPAGEYCFDDGNICTSEECDGAGTCLHPPTAAGSFCYDDGEVCTSEQCDGAGSCVHPAVPSGQPCPSDGLECTDDECNGAGACAHPPSAATVPCTSDGNECTNDLCNGAGACGHPAVANGTACDDDNACTQTDQCMSGNCNGTNPIVCPTSACYAAETCDPDSGTCSTCPVGYAQGGGGCQKTYPIDVTLLDNQSYYCDGTGDNRYEGCTGTPYGFHWTDTGDGSVGVVTRVDLDLEVGIGCGSANHNVKLNGTTVGAYPDLSDCLCYNNHQPHQLANVNASSYVKGGANVVSIDNTSYPYCAGLSRASSGYYAVVTVTYADPGPQPEMETSCRAALKSKLKYKNSSTDTSDKLSWKWGKGAETTAVEFGNPTDDAAYELCIFRESAGAPQLLFAADVPPSSSLWKASGTKGYKYSDGSGAQEGVSKTLLKGGAANKAKVILKAKGAGLGDPTLPLAMGTTGIRVQLTNEANGLCWESEFPIAQVTHDASGIKASDP